MKRKANQVTVRLPEDLMGRLDAACAVVDLDTSTIVKACIKAFVEEVEKHGEIRLPLAVISKAEKKDPASTPQIGGLESMDSIATPPRLIPRYPTDAEALGHRVRPEILAAAEAEHENDPTPKSSRRPKQ